MPGSVSRKNFETHSSAPREYREARVKMLLSWKTFLMIKFICLFSLFLQASGQSSLSLTEDRPPDYIKVTAPGNNVTLGWGFSLKDSTSILSGPWEAQDVLEMSFGIWKSRFGVNMLFKKLVVVDNLGKFKVRRGYGNKTDWSYSVNKLTFVLKEFSIQDEASYGINVEFIGSDQRSLTDTAHVDTAAQYNKQTGNLTAVRNETAYTSETIDLFLKRSAYDKMGDFFRYRIHKGNIYIITLGKEEDRKHGACVNDSLLGQCQQRYSLRYINETYVSFRLSNLTLLDSGLYTLEAYFTGITHDPEYTEVYVTVLEKASAVASVEPAHETSNPKAKGSQPDVQFSITFYLVLMISHALFQTEVVTC